MFDKFAIPRRDFLRDAARGGIGAGLAGITPAWAQLLSPGLARPLPTVSGNDIALTIGKVAVRVDGKVGRAVGVDGTVPAPLIRLKEGQKVCLHVTNTLDEDSSIHWHGLLVPFASPTNSRSSSRGPIGTTATRATRKKTDCTARNDAS